MKQDAFERLAKLVNQLEAQAQAKADEQMMDGIRAGIDIVERLVVALERIAANTAPMVITEVRDVYAESRDASGYQVGQPSDNPFGTTHS